jgi:hypothetical protein
MFGPSLRWIDWWRRGAALGWGMPDPRQLRNWWLADMRQLTAEYLKSPAFLALMRFNLALLTQPTMIKAAPVRALPAR